MNIRTIKFRVWDVNTMVYDPLLYPEGGSPISLNKYFEPNNPDYLLMQFTGLKDKNGKEIYEGDLVKENDCIAEVIWTNDVASKYKEVKGFFGEIVNLEGFLTTLAQFKFKYLPGKRQKSFHIQNFEVIGNIYENPELLTS